MLDLIGWIAAGLLVGGLARWIVPGRQRMGLLLTMVLGIVGALAGGWISWLLWGRPHEPFAVHAWPGFLLATFGAVVVLWVVDALARRAESP